MAMVLTFSSNIQARSNSGASGAVAQIASLKEAQIKDVTNFKCHAQIMNSFISRFKIANVDTLYHCANFINKEVSCRHLVVEET